MFIFGCAFPLFFDQVIDQIEQSNFTAVVAIIVHKTPMQCVYYISNNTYVLYGLSTAHRIKYTVCMNY